MEKFWARLRDGHNTSDDGIFPTGDRIWDVSRKYLHTGILEIARQNYNEDIPEIQLWVDIIMQAGKDLHNSDHEIRNDAMRYIESEMFEDDCGLIGLEDEILRLLFLKSVTNKDAIQAMLNGED